MKDKNDVITFRIESDTKKQFAQYCKDNFTTPSQMLYSIIHQKLKYSGKRISLQEFKEIKK